MSNLTPLAHHERRKNPRFTLVTRGELAISGVDKAWSVYTNDISMGGVGIVHDEPLPAGVRACLSLTLMPNGQPEVFTAVVRIQHCTFGGMQLRTGLQLIGMTLGNRMLLERTLLSRTEIPELEPLMRV